MTRQETELLMRLIENLQESMEQRLDATERRSDARFDGIEKRLDTFDRRFEDADKAAAELRGMSKVAVWVGSGIVFALGAGGTWLVQNGPMVLKAIGSIR